MNAKESLDGCDKGFVFLSFVVFPPIALVWVSQNVEEGVSNLSVLS